MFCNFEPNFIEKFLWKTSFPNFSHVTNLAKRKFEIEILYKEISN